MRARVHDSAGKRGRKHTITGWVGWIVMLQDIHLACGCDVQHLERGEGREEALAIGRPGGTPPSASKPLFHARRNPRGIRPGCRTDPLAVQKPGAIRAQPGIVRLTSGSLHERSLATKKRRPSRDQLRQTSTVHAKQPARLGKLVGPANAPSTVNRAFRSRI